MTTAHLNPHRHCVPDNNVHDASIVFAEQLLADPLQRARPGRLCLGWWI
jgi:hypothetical protein